MLKWWLWLDHACLCAHSICVQQCNPTLATSLIVPRWHIFEWLHATLCPVRRFSMPCLPGLKVLVSVFPDGIHSRGLEKEGGNRSWTGDLSICSRMLCHWAIPPALMSAGLKADTNTDRFPSCHYTAVSIEPSWSLHFLLLQSFHQITIILRAWEWPVQIHCANRGHLRLNYCVTNGWHGY